MKNLYIQFISNKDIDNSSFKSFLEESKCNFITDINNDCYRLIITYDTKENKTCFNLMNKAMLKYKSLEINEYHIDINSEEFTLEELNEIVLAFELSMYKYRNHDPKHLIFDNIKDSDVICEKAYIASSAINNAREVSNTPSNLMHPKEVVDHIYKVIDQSKVQIEVFDKEKLTKMGAGGILAVNQGSIYEPYMVVMKYIVDPSKDVTCLVGKGITFDSGGYALKSRDGMIGMKYDMCGAANVIATMEMISKMGCKNNVIGIVGLTENMIDATSYKMDDVIIMLDGTTVEVTNTDAEGRLVLADCLTYASNDLKAKTIIDIATLTGACVAALGSTYTGVFTTDDELYNEFSVAAKHSNEAIWRLPINEEYTSKLKTSFVADIKNSVKAMAGASMAAGFLNEFVHNSRYLHLDIAGTSDKDTDSEGNPKGATGVMIRSMYNMVNRG